MKFAKQGLEAYITDNDLESERGVLLNFGQGLKIRVLRAGGSNKRFIRALQSALRPHRRAMEMNTLDDELADEIVRKVYCKHVVIGWQGVKDEEGNPVPFSPEAAEEFFSAFPNLFEDVSKLAQAIGTFSEERIEEAREALGED